MGGRGSSNPRGGGGLVGKSVADLGITYNNIEKKLGLSDLTAAQKNTLLDMFRGIEKNDYSYDSDHTPYKVNHMDITQPNKNDDLIKSNDVYVSIETGGNTGRYVDSMDVRYRMFFIGKKGGPYTYSRGGQRKTVSGYEVAYGKREL